MDFFAQQDHARRKTKWLVLYFSLAVVSMIVMIYFVALFANFYFLTHRHFQLDESSSVFSLWDPEIFLVSAAGTLAVIFIGSSYKIMALAGGGSVVAESLDGRLVATNSTNPDERKLLNIVEEMSIASGVPMPKVYVLDNEDYINACAAGHTPGDAVIAVTHNCMTKLTRDELQGVIGHEFSHILNGDMRLNLRLIGLLFGIFCIATIGRILLQVRGSGRDRNPLPLIGLLLLVIGSLGVFFGRLIQAAVSRQREFLADASSVQFTRNPGGLSGALQKVGGYGSRMLSPHAPDAGHLFFGNALGDGLFDLMSTHPPLDQRIRAIDSTWDGKYKRLPEDKPGDLDLYRTTPKPRSAQPVPDIFRTVLGGTILAAGSMDEPPIVRTHAVLPNLGNPTLLHLNYAEKLRDALPENIKTAAREPLDAGALIFALLLQADNQGRATQIAEIGNRFSPAVSEKTAALYPEVAAAAKHARLPMVVIALGALKQLKPEEFNRFSQTLEWLVKSDGKIELYEYVLQKIVLHHLTPQFAGTRPPTIQFYTLKPLVPDCTILLSALANVGSSEPAEIQKAFATGMPYLRAPDETDLVLLPREQCGVTQIDTALNRLAQAVPIIKKNLLEACIHTVGADGVMTESEAELLRAVADTLDCPMPPFVATE